MSPTTSTPKSAPTTRTLRSSKSMTSLSSQLTSDTSPKPREEEKAKPKPKARPRTLSTTTTDTESSDLIVVNEFRERLVLLHHASYCEHSNAFPPKPCRLTPNCLDILLLLQHVTECQSPLCTEPECATTKFVRNHLQQCKVYKCTICTPLHQSIERKRQLEESFHVQQKKRRGDSFDTSNTIEEMSTFRKLSDGSLGEDVVCRSMGAHLNCGRRIRSSSDLMHCYELEAGTFPPFFTNQKPLYIDPSTTVLQEVHVCSPLTISEHGSSSSDTSLLHDGATDAKRRLSEVGESPQKPAFYIPHPAHFTKSTSSSINFVNISSPVASLQQQVKEESSQQDVFNAIVDFMEEVEESQK